MARSGSRSQWEREMAAQRREAERHAREQARLAKKLEKARQQRHFESQQRAAVLMRWIDAPDSGGLHQSTLIQQLLSLIVQHGGVSPLQAYQALCSTGPFSQVTIDLFAR